MFSLKSTPGKMCPFRESNLFHSPYYTRKLKVTHFTNYSLHLTATQTLNHNTQISHMYTLTQTHIYTLKTQTTYKHTHLTHIHSYIFHHKKHKNTHKNLLEAPTIKDTSSFSITRKDNMSWHPYHNSRPLRLWSISPETKMDHCKSATIHCVLFPPS